MCLDLCIARDCFMILMLRSFQFIALSRGNQRSNCLIKRLAETYSGDLVYISRYQKLCNFATGIFASEHRHFTNNNLYITNIYSETAVTSHLQPINQEYIYTSAPDCWGLEFQFLRVPTCSRLPCRSTLPHSTFPTHHRLWNTIRYLIGC